MLDNSLQVTAEEFDSTHAALLVWKLTPEPGYDRLTITEIFAITDIIGGVSIGKAVGENLVKDGVMHPGGGLIARKEAKIAGIRWCIAQHSGGSEPPVAFTCQEQKAIVVLQHLDLDLTFPPASGSIFSDELQWGYMLLAIGVRAQENAFNRSIQTGTHAELDS